MLIVRQVRSKLINALSTLAALAKKLWQYSLWVTVPVVVSILFWFSTSWLHFTTIENAVSPEQQKSFQQYLTYHKQKLAYQLLNQKSFTVEQSTFPTLKINVKHGDLVAQNMRLPQSGKAYIRATLLTSEGVFRGRIRHRGNQPLHWRDDKRSYRIKLQKGSFYNGLRSFELIAMAEMSQLNSQLAFDLAKSLKLLTPKAFIIRLAINNSDLGYYQLIEPINEQFLINQNLMPHDIYSGDISDGDHFTLTGEQIAPELFSHAGFWQKPNYNSDYDPSHNKPLSELIALLNSPTVSYRLLHELLDYEQFIKLHIFNQIVETPNTDHQRNWRLYYDYNRGKFVPIIYDAEGWRNQQLERIEARLHTIIKADPLYKKLSATLANTVNKELTFFANQSQQISKAYKNAFKSESLPFIDLGFIDYQQFNESLDKLNQKISTLVTEFQRSINTAVEGENETLKPLVITGNLSISGIQHYFQPVEIKAGTKLTLEQGALLVFHQGLNISGTEANPVSISKASDAPFASIVVKGQGSNDSKLAHCIISGGSHYDDGIYRFKGMLTLTDVNGVTINNCTLSDNSSEEMLHVTYAEAEIDNSQFIKSHLDAIDVELAKLTITNSTFLGSGAEAIDSMNSQLQLTNLDFIDSGDNAISLGQKSQATISSSRFIRNKRALLVKDSANVTAELNEFKANTQLYKLEWENKNYSGGGKLHLISNNIDNLNGEKDEHSSLKTTNK
jgi:hypothetical protein